MAPAHALKIATETDAAKESARLAELDRLDILNTPREEAFDRITRLIRDVLHVPVAIVSMIDGHRQWYKSSEGTDASEVERKDSFCQFTIEGHAPVIVPDATQDQRFASSKYVVNDPGIRFYAGIPLATQNGQNIGTVCAVDFKPRKFSVEDLNILTSLAAIAMDEIELRNRAATDDLTGVFSRRTFKEEGTRALALAHRHKHPLSCIILDIDHFKAINDTHGHPAGDEVLFAAANTCRKYMRQTDLLGRLGGEEFGILLPHTDGRSAMRVAEKLRKGIEGLAVAVEGATILLTASFGVATLNGAIKDIDTLIANADSALYEAKAAGRNRIVGKHVAQQDDGSLRRRVLKAGVIAFNNKTVTRECTVRALSKDGAGLDVSSSVGIPDWFHLIIRADNFETSCRVVTRTEKHLGVEFR
jgi:diguanylate cyclase (GGDEF)-like protein